MSETLALFKGTGFSKAVGRPALGRQGEAGSPSYMTLDFSGARFRFSEVVGRPALGCPEEAGCPRHWFCFEIKAEQWRCGMGRKVEM